MAWALCRREWKKLLLALVFRVEDILSRLNELSTPTNPIGLGKIWYNSVSLLQVTDSPVVLFLPGIYLGKEEIV